MGPEPLDSCSDLCAGPFLLLRGVREKTAFFGKFCECVLYYLKLGYVMSVL